MSALPDSIKMGRGMAYPGPIVGAVSQITLGPFDLAAGLTTGQRILGFVAPFNLRIQRITWNLRATGGGTATTLLYHNATLAVAAATTIMASQSIVAAGGVEGAGFASSVAREVAKGRHIFIDPLTQASTGTVSDLVIAIAVVCLDFPVADVSAF